MFLEYAWDMGWCDPCAADPLSADELRELGVFWLRRAGDRRAAAHARGREPAVPQNVFVTRLHVRYDKRALPRGPRVPGDRRPRRTSRAATCCGMPGQGGARAPRPTRYRARAARAAGARGPDAGVAHRLADRRHPPARPGVVPASDRQWRTRRPRGGASGGRNGRNIMARPRPESAGRGPLPWRPVTCRSPRPIITMRSCC